MVSSVSWLRVGGSPLPPQLSPAPARISWRRRPLGLQCVGGMRQMSAPGSRLGAVTAGRICGEGGAGGHMRCGVVQGEKPTRLRMLAPATAAPRPKSPTLVQNWLVLPGGQQR